MDTPYLIFDHVHIVVCGLRLLLSHFFQMVHQVRHIHPEVLGVCALRCGITDMDEKKAFTLTTQTQLDAGYLFNLKAKICVWS